LISIALNSSHCTLKEREREIERERERKSMISIASNYFLRVIVGTALLVFTALFEKLTDAN
jgi:hypothetical protein